MVADQEPTTSEHKHWTRFLNRETAFYMGAEEIARVTRYPAFFVGMRRVSRGFYEMELNRWRWVAKAHDGGDDGTLCTAGGSADSRGSAGLAVVPQAVAVEEVAVREGLSAIPARRASADRASD